MTSNWIGFEGRRAGETHAFTKKGKKQRDLRWCGKVQTVPRLVLILNGDHPRPREQVLHSCDVRLWARRTHLSLGLPLDNTLDMIAKGRQRFEGLKVMQQPGVPRL